MAELESQRHDKHDYITTVRERIAEQEALLTPDRRQYPTSSDQASDS
jgi:hypothetical protein